MNKIKAWNIEWSYWPFADQVYTWARVCILLDFAIGHSSSILIPAALGMLLWWVRPPSWCNRKLAPRTRSYTILSRLAKTFTPASHGSSISPSSAQPKRIGIKFKCTSRSFFILRCAPTLKKNNSILALEQTKSAYCVSLNVSQVNDLLSVLEHVSNNREESISSHCT